MKRLLISVLCSAGIVFGYFFLLVILYQLFQISFDTLALLLTPLNIPYNIYKSIFGLYYGNPNHVKILNYAALISICALPFYLIFTLYDKIKKTSENQSANSPPEPPAF